MMEVESKELKMYYGNSALVVSLVELLVSIQILCTNIFSLVVSRSKGVLFLPSI